LTARASNHYYVYEMQDKKRRDKKKTEEQTQLFAALSDPTRLRLLHLLCHQSTPGCYCVNNLSELLGITQPAVSQHLRVLKSVGLITGEKRGFYMHYQIDPEGIKRCQEICSTTLEFPESCSEDYCPQNFQPPDKST
jgi:ArsR family transcriptional regulator, arsenate/arsenite/antimonite-responsive transcriptional repressor